MEGGFRKESGTVTVHSTEGTTVQVQRTVIRNVTHNLAQLMEYGRIGLAGENVVCRVVEEYRHASETVTVHFTAEQTAPVPMRALKRAIRNRVLWMESSRIGQIGASVTSHAGEGHSLEVVLVMVLSMVVRTVLAPGKRPRHATHKIAQRTECG